MPQENVEVMRWALSLNVRAAAALRRNRLLG